MWAEYFAVFEDSEWIDTIFPEMASWLAPFESFASEISAALRE